MPRLKKQVPLPKPKRQKKEKPIKRALVNAAYTDTGRIVCEACFSRPSIALRMEFDAAGQHGYSIHHHSDGFTLPDGDHFEAQRTLYPCSNPECFSAIQVFNIAGVYGKEGHAPMRQSKQLSDLQLLRYYNGKTDAGGVWHTKEIAPSPN